MNRPDDSSEDEQPEHVEGQHPVSPPTPAVGEHPALGDSFAPERPDDDPSAANEGALSPPPDAVPFEDHQTPAFEGRPSPETGSPVHWEEEQAPAPPQPTPPLGEWDTWTPPSTFRADDGLERYPTPAYVDPDAGPGAPWTDEPGDESGFDAPHKSSRSRSVVRELVETGLMALLVFLAVRATFQNYRVHGHSMDPNLQDGEFLLVNRIEYAQINIDKLSNFVPFLSPGDDPKRDVFTSPQRGDVIILEDPRQPQGDRLVKRVIGLPGDKLEIVSGTVYINGRLLHEPYIPSPGDYTSPPIVIPPNQFFVMGDNRRNSEDSRYLGLIPRDLIIGKAMIAMWPTDKFGFAPNERPVLDPQVTR